MRRVSSLDSMGIKALALNAREYGVSLIGCFGVVQYAQSKIGTLSTHFPFSDVNLFFRYPSNVLFVTLAWALD